MATKQTQFVREEQDYGFDQNGNQLSRPTAHNGGGRPLWQQRLNQFAAENRGDALPERNIEDFQPGRPAPRYNGRGQRKIMGYTNAQRSQTMRAYRGQPTVESAAMGEALKARRAQANLPPNGQETNAQTVTQALTRKQKLIREGYSSSDADRFIEQQDAKRSQGVSATAGGDGTPNAIASVPGAKESVGASGRAGNGDFISRIRESFRRRPKVNKTGESWAYATP